MFSLRSFLVRTTISLFLLIGLALEAPAQSRETDFAFPLYATKALGDPDGGKLIIIDPLTGTYQVAQHQFPAGLHRLGLAYDPHRGVLWTIAPTANGGALLTCLNPFTGAIAYTAALPTPVYSLTYRHWNGMLYGLEIVDIDPSHGIHENWVRSIDPQTGASERVVEIVPQTFPDPNYLVTTQFVFSLAFDPLNSQLYIIAGLSNDSSRLYALDMQSGTSTIVRRWPLGRAMTFMPDTHMVFSTNDGSEDVPYLLLGTAPDGELRRVGYIDGLAGLAFVPHVAGGRD